MNSADPRPTDATPAGAFKTCPNCGHAWTTRRDLIDDPGLSFLGYQAFLSDGVIGLFLFNHLSCRTTLTVSARHFEDLHHGEVRQPRPHPPPEATGYCLSADDPGGCPPQCECGFVQEVIELVTGPGSE